MWQTFREGGWPMWALVLLGGIAILTAFRFALRPAGDQVGFLKWMMGAIASTIAMSVCQDWVTVAHAVDSHGFAATLSESERWGYVIQATGECLSPGAFGFAILAVIAILVAVGQRKLDAKEA